MSERQTDREKLTREILFRGKTRDTGEWVQGDFSSPGNITFIGQDFDELTGKVVDDVLFDYSVLPETVGQFTGLYDMYCNDIFEGDVVTYNGSLFSIHWHSTWGLWYMRSVSSNQIKTFNFVKSSNCEIIGNIHDNPELLQAV